MGEIEIDILYVSFQVLIGILESLEVTMIFNHMTNHEESSIGTTDNRLID